VGVELGPWSPLTVGEVVGQFNDAPFRWWVAGGHALEAHLGQSWRPHDDTDVGIQRSEVSLLAETLVGWDLHRASNGVLTLWGGEPVEQVVDAASNIWCRRTPEEPWALDVLIGEGSSTEWVFRRDYSVRRPWQEAVLATNDGMPYLAPEIQLLFKSKQVRAKDQMDAAHVIPQLDADRQRWLQDLLPPGHEWHDFFTTN